MTCTHPDHNGNQGRACLCATQASRAVFGLPPLHQDDGGHSVHGGISFPLDDSTDETIATPEQAGAWTVYAQVVLIAIVVGCLCAAFIQIVLPRVTH